jgi:hypothetical protein
VFHPSFRDASFGAGPESISLPVVLTNGFRIALREPRNDEVIARRANVSQAFSLVASGKSPLSPRAIPASSRGAFRDRHERWARDAVDTTARGRTALTWTAKSCGPDASTLASSWRQCCALRRRWWQESPIAKESTKETVKTIRVRECRAIPAVTVVTMLVCFVFSHTRLRVRRAPGIPHALRGADDSRVTRAHRAARMRRRIRKPAGVEQAGRNYLLLRRLVLRQCGGSEVRIGCAASWTSGLLNQGQTGSKN